MPLKFKTKLIGIVLAVIAATAVGGYVWRGSERAQIARHALAPPPDVQGVNPELAERIRTAQDDIQKGHHPIEALSTLTRLCYANGMLESSASTCAALLELEPKNAQWSYLLALHRANAGQLDEALPLFRRTIALAPGYLPARLKTADALAKLNQVEAAVAMEQTVVEKDPANIYAWVGLGNIYAAQKKWDLARDSFQKAISFSSGFRSAWQGLVLVYEATGNVAAAAEAQTQVDEVSRSPDSPDPWIDALQEECYNIYLLRVAAYSSTDLDFSRRLLERAVRLQPEDAAAHKDFGMLLLRAGAFAEAQRSLQRATTLAPADSDTWLSLIAFYRAIRDEAGIEKGLQNGLAHCPASAGLWLERGRLLARAHSFEGALAALAKSAELGPKDAAPHVESAVVLFQTERTDHALRELKTALAMQPNHPFAQCLMTRYAISIGDQPTALSYYEKTRRNPKVMAEDKQQLGIAFEAAFGPAPRLK